MGKYIKVLGGYDLKLETIKEKENPNNYFLLVIKHIDLAVTRTIDKIKTAIGSILGKI